MASVCLPRNYTERENSDFGRYCVGKSCTSTLMLIAVTRRSKKISGAPKMISADDPDERRKKLEGRVGASRCQMPCVIC
jgi:hypothetical protein